MKQEVERGVTIMIEWWLVVASISLTIVGSFSLYLLKQRQRPAVQGASPSGQKEQPSSTTAANLPQGSAAVIAVALLIPILALYLYLPAGMGLGASTEWLISEKLTRISQLSPAEREQSLRELLPPLEQLSPSDRDAQRLRGEIHSALGQHAAAAERYRHLLRDGDEPQLLASLAQSLYLDSLQYAADADASSFPHQAKALLKRALALAPEQLLALSLSGIAAYSDGDYSAAITHWRRALRSQTLGSAQSDTLKQSILRAEQLYAQQMPAQARIPLTISIDRQLLNSQDSDDSAIFVYARATDTPLPLAARKLRLADLPANIVLSEHDRMSTHSLLEHSRAIVSARLSRGGTVQRSDNDIYAPTIAVKVLTSGQEATATALRIGQHSDSASSRSEGEKGGGKKEKTNR